MACRTCGCKEVADPYKCGPCHLKDETYIVCVITKISNLHYCDQIDTFTRAEAKDFMTSNMGDFSTYRENYSFLKKMDKDRYFYSYKSRVFHAGEILFLEPDFEREITGRGRKPAKWDVEYEYFKPEELQKAFLRARQAAEEDNT